MKLLYVTPRFDYETFTDGSNPLEEAKVYDISTEELYSKAKKAILRESLTECYEFEELLVWPQKPSMPKLTLKQAGDPQTVKELTEKYDRELSEYTEAINATQALCEKANKDLNSLTDSELNLFWSGYEIENENATSNDQFPYLYYYDTEVVK